MPTFNRAGLIVQSAQSVIDQSFRDWELLIVDDGSTDDTAERIEALGDSRIVLLRQPRIGNSARLRNLGVAAARGNYVAFLDSDDLWVPSKLEIQLRALTGKPGAWCYAGHALIDAEGNRMPLRSGRFAPVAGRIARQLLTDETGASIITWLVPRALLVRVGGFDESLRMSEDLDLVLRLAQAADAVAVPDTLAFAREHPGRKTKSSDQHRHSATVFAKAASHFDDPALGRLAMRRCAGHLASAGETLLAQGELAGGVALLAKALLRGAGFGACGRAFAAGSWRLFRKPG
jgi:glycosyltransferase involved in cell wall biosynthesis